MQLSQGFVIRFRLFGVVSMDHTPSHVPQVCAFLGAFSGTSRSTAAPTLTVKHYGTEQANVGRTAERTGFKVWLHRHTFQNQSQNASAPSTKIRRAAKIRAKMGRLSIGYSFHTAICRRNSSIVSILPPHHSGRFARTTASAIGGQTAFPHRATFADFG